MVRTHIDRSKALIDEDQLVALEEPWGHLVGHAPGTPLVELAANPVVVNLTVLVAGRQVTRRAFSLRRVATEWQGAFGRRLHFYDLKWVLHAYTHLAVGVNNKQIPMGSDVEISTGDVISVPRTQGCDKRPISRAVAAQGDLPVPCDGPRWAFRANHRHDAAAGRLLLASTGEDLRGLQLPRGPALSDVMKQAEREGRTPGEIVTAESRRACFWAQDMENNSPHAHARSPATEPKPGWRKRALAVLH